jgi:uncharacterized protein with ParB-like and HNH nuclease domain
MLEYFIKWSLEVELAKANLLTTQTPDFLELVGNGKSFFVPQYQRDYSWDEENWEDLWEDVIALKANPEARHYMGALVVDARDDRRVAVIDGQQRLATLTILGLAIIAKIKALAEHGVETDDNLERVQRLRNRFIGEKDPASLMESSKLSLNSQDDPFFQEYLVQLHAPRNSASLPKSNKLLWKCYRFFSDQITKLPEEQKSGEELARFLSETIARQLKFILITVDDELGAYTIFETLNARGLELSATDLLKNYLFSLVQTQADIELLQRKWTRIISTVKYENFPEFLRYHLLCSERQVRKQRLFKMIKEKVKTNIAAFELLSELDARAELFQALTDSNDSFWLQNPDCKNYIRDLSLFRISQFTPILFAAWEKLQANEFLRVLKSIVTIGFRYTVVSNLNTNKLEPVSHDVAKAILDNSANSPAKVFRKLREIYIDDESFVAEFQRLSIDTRSQKKIAKYILTNLEAQMSGRAVDWTTDPATLEHILPENPTGGWSQVYEPSRWDADVARLGNISLLESEINREIGNQLFPVKLNGYQRSRYLITNEIARIAPEEWTVELLNERQRQFAEIAKSVWRDDFIDITDHPRLL